MPIRVGTGPKGEPEFRFRSKDENSSGDDSQNGGNDERVYRLIQTVVRRIREDGSVALPKTKIAGKANNSAKPKKKSRTAQ
jgi:hypothetical protein